MECQPANHSTYSFAVPLRHVRHELDVRELSSGCWTSEESIGAHGYVPSDRFGGKSHWVSGVAQHTFSDDAIHPRIVGASDYGRAAGPLLL